MRRLWITFLMLGCVFISSSGEGFDRREQCTSLLVTAGASADGVPILWKNRDTGVLSNRVVFVDEDPLDYLALVDRDDPSGRRCFAGLNSAGFAIINTVAYNLPERDGEVKDQEGTIMADALRTCRTVGDFRRYLESGTGPNLGSLANFGVMDRDGVILLFEVHNHGFTVQDPAASPKGYLVNTNFARSGEAGTGAGYLRFKRAVELADAIDEQPIAFETILTRFSRDTGHVLLHTPIAEDFLPESGFPDWISTKDCINKYHTAACVVFVGGSKGENGTPATMWVIPGEPLTAAAIPLWVAAGASPDPLWNGQPDAPLWGESLRIKKIIRPLTGGNQADYLFLPPLRNRDHSGIRDLLGAVEQTVLEETAVFLKQPHTPAEYRQFQEKMTDRVLQAMQNVK